jgi:hypothetical protein
MRASTTFLTLILLVASTAAQAETRPDYSPAGLQRLFAGQPENTRDDDPLRFSYGVIDYRFRTTHLQFSPALLPLSGTELRTTTVWPDPFSLTRTPIATSKRAWRTQRTLNAELRRIEKLERAKVRVKAN